MITKAPIRLLTLAQLDLRRHQTLWDIGFCTGSVSIEAKLQFPHLHVVAFEQRPEGKRLMELNAARFGTPGIITRIGDFLQAELDDLPAPTPYSSAATAATWIKSSGKSANTCSRTELSSSIPSLSKVRNYSPKPSNNTASPRQHPTRGHRRLQPHINHESTKYNPMKK